jgi:hypothetical protein
MSNRFRFSRCESPHLPITEVWEEEITVELRQNILTITANETRLLRSPRIYSLLTLEAAGMSIFMIMPTLPLKLTDTSFFPAQGSVVLFAPDGNGVRRLQASGMDKNSGQCRGWIFDASETQ